MPRDLTIRDIFRATGVRRWHMVPTERPQTIADHTFRVTMLSIHLWRALHGFPNGGGDSAHTRIPQGLIMWALWHDMPEVVYGDVPSPVKEEVSQTYPELFHDLDSRISDTWASLERGVRGTYVAHLVKIADITESLCFLREGYMCHHRQVVYIRLLNKLHEKLRNVREEFGRREHVDYDWTAVEAAIDELLADEGAETIK